MKFLPAAMISLAVMGFAAGCGAGSDPDTGTAATFVDCMKQNGVELPTARPSGNPGGISGSTRPSGMPTVRPSGGPGGAGGPGGGGMGQLRPSGVDDATWQKALQACGSLRPSGGPGGGLGNGRNEAYLDCLSQYGVTPSPGQTLPSAAAACEVLRASRAPQ